jgi:hypothetical protein
MRHIYSLVSGLFVLGIFVGYQNCVGPQTISLFLKSTSDVNAEELPHYRETVNVTGRPGPGPDPVDVLLQWIADARSEMTQFERDVKEWSRRTSSLDKGRKALKMLEDQKCRDYLKGALGDPSTVLKEIIDNRRLYDVSNSIVVLRGKTGENVTINECRITGTIAFSWKDDSRRRVFFCEDFYKGDEAFQISTILHEIGHLSKTMTEDYEAQGLMKATSLCQMGNATILYDNGIADNCGGGTLPREPLKICNPGGG